jgi:crossover junction endodeoxyribonuclease RuvC
VTDCVLGVDPGTRVTGYGLVERGGRGVGRLLECGVIRTSAKLPLSQRLAEIHAALAEVIRRHRPETLAVESVFYRRNVRSTMVLSHARGCVLLAAAQAGVAVAEFAPATVKKAIAGNGSATKSQVGFMVQQLLRLESPPSPDDAADGVAIALTYLLTSHS